MFYSSFGILAIILHIIINYDLLIKDDYKDIMPANAYYRKYLLFTMLFYLADISWGVLYEHKMIRLCYGDTVLFFLTMVGSVFTWTRFVMNYLDDNGKLRFWLYVAGWIIVAYEVVFLIINLFVPVLFQFHEDGTYEPHRGRLITLTLQIVLYMSASLYSLILSVRREGKMKYHYRTIGISGIAMAVFIILQTTDPLIPYYAIGCMMGTALLHTFVLEDEKRDQKNELVELLTLEKRQRRELENAKRMAYTDSLTGVKNKHAYIEKETALDEKIMEEESLEFGVIAFDVNDLKYVNDTFGHEKGDQWIQSACHIICGVFHHSPVFRTGGDEFTVILEGQDFENREELLEQFHHLIQHNIENNQVVIAAGCAVYRPEGDSSYQSVFERADRRMYAEKARLKE